MSFRDYVAQFDIRRRIEKPHITHTWFSPTLKTVTLHVPLDKNEEFYQRLFDYITRTNSAILENPIRGENALTEKVVTSVNKFYMFADIDFGVDIFERHNLPTDNILVKQYMCDLIRMYDDLMEKTYGTDLVKDRILAVRLPYKIHLIYSDIVASKQIAEHISNQFVNILKKDPRFSDIISENEKIIDKSVYSTGLRMAGMHKGNMSNKKSKMEHEWKVHENIFGENTYRHCYKFVDVDSNLDTLPFTFERFKRSSIRVLDEKQPYTKFLDETVFNKIMKGKGRAVAVATTTPSGRSNLNISVASSSKSPFLFTKDEDDAYDENTIHTSAKGGFTQQMLINSLGLTIKFLKRMYNHLINEEKIIYKEKKDPDGNANVYLVFPLVTKECHFAGKIHEGNHQYLLLDKKGSRQQCHKCEGEHKVIKPGRMPNNVKEELVKLDIFKNDVVVKQKKNTPSEKEKLSAVTDLVDRVRHYYPKNDLVIDQNKVVINDFGIHIPLQDLWCEVCKTNHERPCTYLLATETGKMCLKCEINPTIGLFYPNPPLTIDPTTRQFFFSNCNVSFVSNNIHNYGDTTGDVSVDFEEEPIFEDETLNHLIFESLAGTTWPIVKVIHHLGKYNFACTQGGEWYVFKNHKWTGNSESAMLFFISEKIAYYYRQVRDYYQDNTESQELRLKRVSFIQKIIDKLTNINSKMDVAKEAKIYFFEEDYYSLEKGTIHFEERLDEKRHLLCFTNGVYDLDADVFRDGSPYDFLTLTIGFEYNSESDPKKRKTLVEFFESMQPDDDERDYLLLFLSSMLHGMTSEETFHIFTGAASNGKSLLRDLIMHTLGDYFETIPANLLTKERPSSSSPQPEIVRLKGKRAVVGSEPEANQKINTGFMKWITGGDPMQARLLHSNTLIHFQPQFKLILLCNDIPAMDSNDSGTWRRSRIKDFPVIFCEHPRPGHRYEKPIDRTLKEKIHECKQEFVLYLLEYFRRYKNMKYLAPTEKILQMVQKHKKKSNTVLQFIEEKTLEADGENILLVEMYSKYLQFMRSENPGEQPVNKGKMIEELHRMSRTIDISKFVRVPGRKGTQMGVRNRRFVPDEEDDE